MLQVFSFESKQVRFVGTADKPEWIAADVCDCLELANVSQAIDSLDEDEKGITIVDTPGGEQEMLTVTEPGLYNLIFKSRKAPAKRFKRWVFHEILPSIRKNGSYNTNEPALPQASVKEEIDILKTCLEIADFDSRLIAGVALNHAGVRMPQLKEAIAQSHELLAASGQTELLLTPTKIGKELGISSRKVNEILLGMGFQVKNTGKTSKTEPDYLVTESGKPYAGNTMATGKLLEGKADNSTYQHLKWKAEVIDIIRGQIAA